MPDPDGIRHSRTHGRPQWLKDWIENKGRFVFLTCRHKEDLNDKALLIINVFGRHGRGMDVFCERCNKFVGVDTPVRIPPTSIPDEPLF